MAAEADTQGVVLPLASDSFQLIRNKQGVSFFFVNEGKPQLIREALSSAGVTEDGQVKFMGRAAGKIDFEKTNALNECDASELRGILEGWFPPIESRVQHIDGGLEQFNEIIASNDLVVGKFSAEWCGPCKAIAPTIAKFSAQYPGVKFLHIDVDEQKAVKMSQNIKCMPTFIFWKNGAVFGERIEGGDVPKIKAFLMAEAGEPEELDAGEPFTEEITLKIVCEGDLLKLERNSENKITLSMNGVTQAEDCPEIKIDKKTRSFKLGRNPLQISKDLPQEEFDALFDAVAALWPTNVIHVHNDAEFRQILKDNQKVIAKFSADWCGPCHIIAPKYTELSIEYPDIKMLHVDVDQCQTLSQKESVQAMPTFKFYLGGENRSDLMVRGANAASLIANVKAFAALDALEN